MNAREVLELLVTECPYCARSVALRYELIEQFTGNDFVAFTDKVREVPNIRCGHCRDTRLMLTHAGKKLLEALSRFLVVKEVEDEIPW